MPAPTSRRVGSIALLALAACWDSPPPARLSSAPAVQRERREEPGPDVQTVPRELPREPERQLLVFPSRYESAAQFPGSLARADRATWRARAPEVGVVAIESSSDRSRQHALFYDSGSERAKPLLVVLHSWSTTYLQNVHIPYARFAVANDWVFVHPNFRGPNRRREATASDLAVQDVLDAVDYARAHAEVDERRIYLLGYSGGAMLSLVLAGRYPDRFAGVVAWVAVFDLVAWYEHARRRGSRYAAEIAASCGGAPSPRTRAEAECLRRSPVAHLHRASGRTPVLIAHGVRDRLAPATHAVAAFNALAAPEERISDSDRDRLLNVLSGGLRPAARAPRSHTPWPSGGLGTFEATGRPVLFERSSRGATLVLFDGDHDMLYRPGLRWLAAQRRSERPSDRRLASVEWADAPTG